MPETDEQELAKALESVANLGKPKESPKPQDLENSPHDNGVQPIVPSDSPVAPPIVTSGNDMGEPSNTDVSSTPDASVATDSDSEMPKPSPSPVVDSTEEQGVSDNKSSDASAEPVENYQNEAHASDTPAVDTGPLDSIKNEAINELRPLVDKLNVSPEEKFDTYLLLIRSTDDINLIGPAHEAAKAIPDEARKAEALLDIIKEIDYLTHQKNNG